MKRYYFSSEKLRSDALRVGFSKKAADEFFEEWKRFNGTRVKLKGRESVYVKKIGHVISADWCDCKEWKFSWNRLKETIVSVLGGVSIILIPIILSSLVERV